MSKTLEIDAPLLDSPAFESLTTPDLPDRDLPPSELKESIVSGISLHELTRNFGFENFGVRLQLDGRLHTVERFHSSAEGVTQVLRADLADGLAVSLRLCPLARPRQYLLRLEIANESPEVALLESAAFGQFGKTSSFHPGQSHVLGWALRYAHTGNLRTERFPLCAADYPYARQLPIETRVLGDTEDQPFPALLIYNDVTKDGIVLGMTTQKQASPVFTLKRHPLFRPHAFETLEMRWDFPQSRGLQIRPGSSLELDTAYLQLTEGRETDRAFEDYLDHLAAENAFLGAGTPANETALHCTWNYGVFDDQRAEPLLETARFIAHEMPGIGFFLVDDGYLDHDPHSRVFLNRFYPEPNQHLLEKDWPGGMRAFTEQLRSLGLRPGIWWTPTVRLPCQLHDEHPDWFLREADGSLHLIGNDAFLDYSHPEALEFLDRTLKVVLGDWGFEACKIDFWSQNFESRRAVLRDPHTTSIAVRRKFFETVRRHLPPDGVIMSCIAMGMGNPFLGEYVDTYRCSMDISDGTWQDQINSCHWTLPMLGFGGRRSTLLNTDSVGINLELPENENFFRLTWCHITMGLIETGGRLERLPAPYLEVMKKITSRLDRGYPCRSADLRAYTGHPLPEVLYVDYPEESPTAQRGVRQAIAFFNWTDQPRAVSAHRGQLGQPGAIVAEDFWSGAKEKWDGSFITMELEPRSARIFELSW